MNRSYSPTACGGSYLLAESVLTLDQAAKKSDASYGAIQRWRLTGLRGGIRLECYLRASRWITSEEALIRFFDRVNAAARGERVDSGDPDAPSVQPTRTATQRKAASEQAARECQVLGV